MLSWALPPPGSEATMVLSVPVAFQYPEAAALFGLAPFGYFLSLGLKKYHSFSPNKALPGNSHGSNLYISTSAMMETGKGMEATFFLR
uniref:Uncharacterized protein n=1 Tax=Lotus japonicus TaxID=34305 RepID=I3SUD9_LOTJA|nr:unknown [Lotus japonicus]